MEQFMKLIELILFSQRFSCKLYEKQYNPLLLAYYVISFHVIDIAMSSHNSWGIRESYPTFIAYIGFTPSIVYICNKPYNRFFYIHKEAISGLVDKLRNSNVYELKSANANYRRGKTHIRCKSDLSLLVHPAMRRQRNVNNVAALHPVAP
uniref:Uncharacterized protein n=1 Tax=Megaselia scalaris TaxID=36166 RepID=T1GYL4_MEGSC